MSNIPASIPGATPILRSPVAAPMGISVEMVTAAYAALETPVPAEQLESVLWLFCYAKNNKVPGNTAVGKLFNPPRDGSSISKLFSASYGADLSNICADIEKLRALEAQKAEVDGEPVVRLPWLTETVSNFAQVVHATHSIGFIWGRNQSGKTVAIKAHAAASKRRTIRVEMPAGAIKTEFLDLCLEAVGISTKKANGEKAQIFASYLNRDTELIIDEFHQTWITGTLRVAVVEMIRRWRDTRGCSVLLVCTDLDGALGDRRWAGVLDQMMNRGVLRRQIPTLPAEEDVAAIIEAYRLRPPARGSAAAEIVALITAENGLGKLCKYLQVARLLAVGKGQEFAWEHVVATHDNIQAWAAGRSSGKGGK